MTRINISFANVVIVQTATQCVWIGLKRHSMGSSKFIWTDGSSFDGFYDEIKLEPDFYSNNKNCVCIAVELTRTIARTVSCSAAAHVICQKKGTEIVSYVNGVWQRLYS